MDPRTKAWKISRKQNFPALQVKSTMSDIQSKIIRHAKRQENMIHNEKNNQSIGTDTDIRISKEGH